MSLLKHLTESIEHYDRMIEWVKTRPNDDIVNPALMIRKIKEDWYGDYCSICVSVESQCNLCILDRKGYCCDDQGSIWRRMRFSKTWKDWLDYANQMRQILINIRDEVSNEKV